LLASRDETTTMFNSKTPHTLFIDRLDTLRSQLPGCRDGQETSVHDSRVTTRRLRELLQLAAGISPRPVEELQARLGSMGKAAGVYFPNRMLPRSTQESRGDRQPDASNSNRPFVGGSIVGDGDRRRDRAPSGAHVLRRRVGGTRLTPALAPSAFERRALIGT
jgi:hypothetical protein